MVAAASASRQSQRPSNDGSRLLAVPGVALSAVLGLPVVLALSLAAAVDAFGQGAALTWASWLGAFGLGLVTLAVSVARITPSRARRARAWVAVSYLLTTMWVIGAGLTLHTRHLSPEPLDLLLLIGVLATAPPSVQTLSRGVAKSGTAPLVLDALCIASAALTFVLGLLSIRSDATVGSLWVGVYPTAFFGVAAVGLLTLVAAGIAPSPRGAFLLVPGTLLLGAGCLMWTERWSASGSSPELPFAGFAVALLVNAIGIATSGTESRRFAFRAGWADALHDVLPLAAVGAAGFVLIAGWRSNGLLLPVQALALVTLALAVVREATLLQSRRAVLRAVESAQEATRNALDRAESAEARQRVRADQLAKILEASEALVLVGEGEVSYGQILAAITPPGASSFLARLEDTGKYALLASHGEPAFDGIGRPQSKALTSSPSTPRYYSASGRSLAGATRVTETHAGGPDPQFRAAVAFPLIGHTARLLGVLHLADPAEERVLDADFVGLAQLVANQISVALENQALVARVKDHLAEVERVQAQLVAASRLSAVGDLAASVAHEVNNPLTGILGFSEILLTELPEDDPRHEEVAVIRREAIRARGIIRALIDFARPRPAHRVPSDLNGLASEAVEFVRYHASELGVCIVEQYGEIPPVDLDPDAIKQVVVNICNNALRAMPAGGDLSVATRREGDRVALVVGDNGVGMDADTIAMIFDPFSVPRLRGGGGSVGLPVSQQIVGSHGGTIEVSSEPGRGSTFTIWLPIAQTERSDEA